MLYKIPGAYYMLKKLRLRLSSRTTPSRVSSSSDPLKCIAATALTNKFTRTAGKSKPPCTKMYTFIAKSAPPWLGLDQC